MTVFTFTNFTGLAIPDATFSSQSLEVFGMVGQVTGVSIGINGFQHTFASDLDALLLAPDGATNLVFLSDVGGFNDFTGNYLFTDSAVESIVFSGIAPGSYLAGTADDGETGANWNLPSVTPRHAGPSGDNAFTGTFAGVDPNGAWSLHFRDDIGADVGSLTSWTVTLTSTSNDILLNGTGGDDVIVLSMTSATTGLMQVNANVGTFTDYTGTAVLNGGDGNDTLFNNSGSEVLAGGNGIDTVSYSGTSAGVNVSLALAGPQNTGGGGIDTLVGIENLTGSNFDDSLAGNAGANTLNGSGGLNTVSYIRAGAGVSVSLGVAGAQDTLGDGVDTLISIHNLVGSDFADSLIGDTFFNTLEGGLGNDFLDGGDGLDTASFAGASGGVIASLATNSSSGAAGSDTLLNFENLRGSAFADQLTGNADANQIDGGAGADIIDGGDGNDTLFLSSGLFTGTMDGNIGTDTLALRFQTSTVGVQLTVNAIDAADFIILNGNVIALDGVETLGGFATGSAFDDVFDYSGAGSLSNLNAGAGNDIIIGGAALNQIRGEDGDDRMSGGLGNQLMDGGAGSDTVDYAGSSDGVTVDLRRGTLTAISASQGSDAFLAIENVIGSAFADALTGTTLANTLEGGGGDDVLDGRAGSDTASYAGAGAGVAVSLALTGSQNTGGAGNDTLFRIENLLGSAFADTLTGSSGDNTLTGGEGDDTLVGGLGNDRLDGGTGRDTASYAGATGAVSVSLVIAGGQGVNTQGTDTLVSIENLIGSRFADTLVGSGAANILAGGAGADILSGGRGDDILRGGSGDDILHGGTGLDLASFADMTGGVVASLASPGAVAGAGTDVWVSIEGLEGSNFADTLTGNASDNRLLGLAGNDALNGGAGRDTLDGGAGTDTLTGGADNDIYHVDALGDSVVEAAGGGDDRVFATVTYTLGAGEIEFLQLVGVDLDGTGNAGANTLIGTNGRNTLNGAGGDDILFGGRGIDVLLGGIGNDRLIGEIGRDTLTGGDGADRFRFLALDHSGTTQAAADIITDFNRAQGDRIDLAVLDAVSATPGTNEAFTFIGTAAFTAGTAGQVRFFQSGGNTFVELDVNGDATGDLMIRLNGAFNLVAGDFIP